MSLVTSLLLVFHLLVVYFILVSLEHLLNSHELLLIHDSKPIKQPYVIPFHLCISGGQIQVQYSITKPLS